MHHGSWTSYCMHSRVVTVRGTRSTMVEARGLELDVNQTRGDSGTSRRSASGRHLRNVSETVPRASLFPAPARVSLREQGPGSPLVRVCLVAGMAPGDVTFLIIKNV